MTDAVQHGDCAVIYTDGGYRAAVHIGGWGLHGYTYTCEPSKQGTGCKTATLTQSGYMPTDYKLTPDEKPITVKSYVNGFGTITTQDVTNNVAEIVGLTKALEWVQDRKIQQVMFRVDSRYVLEGFTQYMDKWASNGWRRKDGQAVANPTYWQRLHTLKQELSAANVQMQLQWVKGHSGEVGNNIVDANATRAIVAGVNGVPIDYLREHDARGYWRPRGDRSRFLNHPQWYFPSIDLVDAQRRDGMTVYYTGFSGKRVKDTSPVNYLGKETPEARMSVIYLKTPDPVLETIRDTIIEMAAGRYRGLMVGDLTTILDRRRYDKISEYGIATLLRDYSRLRLMYDQDTIACEEISPARLVYRAIDTLNLLEDIFGQFLNSRDEQTSDTDSSTPSSESNVVATEITDLLYETKVSGKKKAVSLKKKITGTLRHMDFSCAYRIGTNPAQTVTVRANIGQDLPDRNTLAALASPKIRVWLLTWPESPHAIRYASVVENEEGIGLWCGPYSNLVLIKS